MIYVIQFVQCDNIFRIVPLPMILAVMAKKIDSDLRMTTSIT